MAVDQERERLQHAVRLRYGEMDDANWKMAPVVEKFLDGNAYFIDFGPGVEDYCYALASLKSEHVDVYDDGIEIMKSFQTLFEQRRGFIQRLGDFSLVELIGALIALTITVTFVFLTISGGELNKDFLGIFALIAGYYFGKNSSAR